MSMLVVCQLNKCGCHFADIFNHVKFKRKLLKGYGPAAGLKITIVH